jgi:endonuclease/exonuclease/phosphatase family metal-dependent hydrolase
VVSRAGSRIAPLPEELGLIFSESRSVTRVLRSSVVVLSLSAAVPVSAATIKVMTYNTAHGGLATTPATTDAQISTIASQNPDVVVLQETYNNQLTYYVNGLNGRPGNTGWHGAYARHCMAGTAPTCTTWASDNVMILTRLATLSIDPVLIWAKDDYRVARGALHMTVASSDGTPVNVFVCHLPALSNAQTSRLTYVAAFQAWAQSFAGPRLVGGDFNDSPGTAPIVAMTQQYSDAWVLAGSGPGYTHSHGGTPTSRIDYWFHDTKGPETLASVSVVGSLNNSDHLAVVATYNVPTSSVPPGGETTLMDDRFDAIDGRRWPGGTITGSQDSTIPVAWTGGTLRIGSLKESTSGTHYNGISSGSYDLSNNGYASVQLTKSPNPSTTAYAMFAVVRDSSNFYRWYQSGPALVAEKKVSGSKTPLVNLPYDPIAHQFLRIRCAYNLSTGLKEVLFETAPNNAGFPGTFTVRYREAWDTHVGASSVKFELKAGTSAPEISPGSANWDNFHAASNYK